MAYGYNISSSYANITCSFYPCVALISNYGGYQTPSIFIRTQTGCSSLSWYSNISIKHVDMSISWGSNYVSIPSAYYYAIFGT